MGKSFYLISRLPVINEKEGNNKPSLGALSPRADASSAHSGLQTEFREVERMVKFPSIIFFSFSPKEKAWSLGGRGEDRKGPVVHGVWGRGVSRGPDSDRGGINS